MLWFMMSVDLYELAGGAVVDAVAGPHASSFILSVESLHVANHSFASTHGAVGQVDAIEQGDDAVIHGVRGWQ